MAEDRQIPHTSADLPYPTDYVVAAIDRPEDAEAAAEALRQAGFAADDIILRHAGQVQRNVQVKEQHRNVFERTLAALEKYTTDEGMDVERYEHEANQGHSIIHVYAPQRAQVDQAAEILRAHHGHTIKHFRSWDVEDLGPLVGE